MGAEEILNARSSGGGPKAKDFVGQVLTIVDFEFANGPYGTFVKITAFKEDGTDASFQTGAGAIMSKLTALRAADLLPTNVQVTSYKTKFPNDGYDIQAVEG